MTFQKVKKTFPPLHKITIKSLDNDAFKNIYIKKNSIFIDGNCTNLFLNINNNSTRNEKLPYVKELLKIYSEKIGVEIKSIKQLEKYKEFYSHFKRQCISFRSAESIKKTISELFSDGEENFKLLENEIYSAVKETYFDINIKDGYHRITETLNMAIKANLNSSIILNIKGCITSEERKGICHILVNDGIINSWVKLDFNKFI